MHVRRWGRPPGSGRRSGSWAWAGLEHGGRPGLSIAAEVDVLHLLVVAPRRACRWPSTLPSTMTVMRSATRNTASMSCSTSRMAWSRAGSASRSACARFPRRPCRPAARRAAAPSGAVARAWRSRAGACGHAAKRAGQQLQLLSPAFAAASRALATLSLRRLPPATRPGPLPAACAASGGSFEHAELRVDGVALVAAARPARARFGCGQPSRPRPSSSMRPAGRHLAGSMLISVLLPAPLVPITACTVPRCSSRRHPTPPPARPSGA